MANRTADQHRTDRVSARPGLRSIAGLVGRATFYAVVGVVLALVCVQFARTIAQVVAARHELASVRSQITQLQRRRDEQQSEIRRLRDPLGAIPEIHDRLRMVRPNEEVIFVSPAPAPTP
jgi:cell division protein FtsB